MTRPEMPRPKIEGAVDTAPVAVFLGVCALLVPGLHWIAIRAYPDEYDSLVVRVVIGLVSGLGLAALGSERTRRYARPTAVFVAFAMQAWFLHLGHVNGPSFARVVNAVLLVGVAAVVLQGAAETVLYVVATGIFMAWAFQSAHPADLPAEVAFATIAVMGASTLVVVRLRDRLSDQVRLQSRSAQELAVEVERRKDAEEDAVQASRAKSAFLASMSHELRTPLNAIIGYTELVSEEIGDCRAQQDLERALEAAHHLLQLIDEVLDLARVESGRLELRPEKVDVPGLVDECLRVLQPAADAARIELVRSVTGRPAAYADRTRTKQILLNLLSNAVKFAPDGRVEVVADCEPGFCVVRVVDDGAGIDPVLLPRLFEAFEKAEDERNRTGTGLGLAIGRQLAERMQGTLQATSTPGGGSCFELRLPVAQPPLPPA